ncbi:MAG: ATP-binding protein [Dorea sp.]|nr:ATP-binding protein [Dorea sp.]
MNEIHITNFGPIKKAVINTNKRMQILIGTQASGKSTVCKVVYFCQKIRDYTLEFLMDASQFTDNHKSEYFNNYMKYLARQFMGCFGKTLHMKKFKIVYYFGSNKIEITLNDDGFIRYIFDEELKNKVYSLLLESSEMFINELNSSKISSIIDNITALAMLKQQFQNRLCILFESETDIIYIPAGRSLLATMSEKLHESTTSDMDLTMQEFINLIRNTKSKFGAKIPDIVKNYTKTVKGQINNSSLELAYEIIRDIFKADYTSESDGEKIYFDERHWVKLMYSSSGQQEVLWILMLSFIIILEKKKSFVIVEEPEAHLFPIAQKKVVDLIALMVNTTGSKAIITTHSPYILTSLNILLYSDKVEKLLKGKAVIQKNLRIPYDSFTAYKLENSADTQESLENLLDEESHMIRTDYIDEVSSISNAELERLLDREMG